MTNRIARYYESDSPPWPDEWLQQPKRQWETDRLDWAMFLAGLVVGVVATGGTRLVWSVGDFVWKVITS